MVVAYLFLMAKMEQIGFIRFTVETNYLYEYQLWLWLSLGMLHDSLQYAQNELKNIKNKLQIRSEVRVYTKSCVKGLILLEAEIYHLYDLELFDYMHKR